MREIDNKEGGSQLRSAFFRLVNLNVPNPFCVGPRAGGLSAAELRKNTVLFADSNKSSNTRINLFSGVTS